MSAFKTMFTLVFVALLFTGFVTADATATPSASPTASSTPTIAPSSTPVSVNVPAASNLSAWWLASSAEYWVCQTNYDITLAQNLSSAYPTATDLAGAASTLQGNEQRLRSLAPTGDVNANSEYIGKTFRPALKEAKKTINHDWRAFVNDKNVSQAQIDAMNAQVKQARADLQNCLFTAAKDRANAKIAYWNYVFRRHESYVAKLTAKGTITDSSGINTLISSATAQVITPLQNALSSATNASQVQQAENQYCLDDGCKKGLNFHYAANFDLQVEVAELNTLSANVSADANLTADTRVSEALNTARTDLAAAQTVLSGIGTQYYQAGQSQEVFAKIRRVSQDINRARRAINAARQNEVRQQREQQARDRQARQRQANNGIA